jgi:ABC-type lipoprotein export system ATPase subunit
VNFVQGNWIHFPVHNLIPNLSVVENVEIPMFESVLSGKKMRQKALTLLDYMNLSDKVRRKPTELSGGERQRVAIARSLANDPSIILADEPTGPQDSKNGEMILNRLKDLHDKEDVTLIMVTHDLNVATLAERTLDVLDWKIKV